MQEEYIVDRIEGGFAVVEKENLKMQNISLEDIKGDPKEGDVLIKDGLKFIVDKEATIRRKNKINEMMKKMWK